MLKQVLAVVYTFGAGYPGVQALLLQGLCLAFATVHMVRGPLRNRNAQRLQTTLLLCLAGVALCSGPFAHALDSATSSDNGGTHTDTALVTAGFASALQTLFSVVIPVIAVCLSFPGACCRMRARVARFLVKRCGV